MRIYGDENMMPTVASQKTIHQRHKSSPALSSMANAGGMKATAKRTAFGDVSNTANTLRSSKDDSVTTNKSEGILGKLAPLKADSKNIPLLRPAQRPVSVVSKGIADNVSSHPVVAPPKQPVAETQNNQPTDTLANTRKILAKKSTAVFKNNVRAPTTAEPEIDSSKPLSITAPIPPVHRDLPSQRTQQPNDELPEPKLRKTRSKILVDAPAKKTVAEPLIVTLPPEEPAAVRSDGVYMDEHGEAQLYQFTDELQSSHHSLHAIDDGVALPPRLVSGSYDNSEQYNIDALASTQDHRMQPQTGSKQASILPSEAEEYWEEEDDENYGEDGYVTARSYRSRGENTTSGATTVLFPKASQKTRKELVAASAWMDAAKAAGDLEDETWDTTMVAEYGDEIFQYMRDLEVK